MFEYRKDIPLNQFLNQQAVSVEEASLGANTQREVFAYDYRMEIPFDGTLN